MKCKKCGKEYPSKYYFKTDTVCVECFEGLSDQDKTIALRDSLMKHPMTSTSYEIEGHKIVKQFGVVRGITVRSRSIFGTAG